MSVLKTLTLVPAPKRVNDPVQLRRVRLLTQLEQQRALAENPAYVATAQRWQRGEDGSKRLVERPKRVKAWWRTDAANQCVLVIRYGAKVIELDKGKAAIAVGDKSNLVTVLDAVIAAVTAGEFDALLANMAGDKRGKKRAA